MIDPSQLSIYQDINKKTFFLPGMNQNLNTSKMKLPVPYGVGAPMVLPIAKQSPNLNPQNEAQEKILKELYEFVYPNNLKHFPKILLENFLYFFLLQLILFF